MNRMKVSMIIVDFIKNIANSFLIYICCVFLVVGITYLEFVTGTTSIFDSVTSIYPLFFNIGYIFLIVSATFALLKNFRLERFYFPFSKIIASILVVSIMLAKPQFIQALCSSRLNMIENVMLCLCCFSLVLEFVYRILKAANRRNIIGTGEQKENLNNM